MSELGTHVGSGKVRELYALADDRLALVASDRISTFDVVLIDTPALESGADAAILARFAGAAVAVARTGLTRTAALDGRPYDIAVGQIDIGNAASEMTERMTQGVPQADGSVRPEPRMDLSAVVDTFLNMARLPLSANVLFTTVMATKMPFVGRG